MFDFAPPIYMFLWTSIRLSTVDLTDWSILLASIMIIYLGSDWKNKILDTSGKNEFPLKRWIGSAFGQSKRTPKITKQNKTKQFSQLEKTENKGIHEDIIFFLGWQDDRYEC